MNMVLSKPIDGLYLKKILEMLEIIWYNKKRDEMIWNIIEQIINLLSYLAHFL